MSKFNARRHFAIRAAVLNRTLAAAKPVISVTSDDAGTSTDNVVTLDGVRLEITERNAAFVESVRQDDAERAYEAAAYGREIRMRIAA